MFFGMHIKYIFACDYLWLFLLYWFSKQRNFVAIIALLYVGFVIIRMSLFIRIFHQLIFWRFELMILCNFRWDLANQCMPKWIETKRKTVEITVKILKWWCITVITVNTQTIGNSSNSCSSSLHHNTFMDPQPPLQVTRGFENNFPWLPCAWFLHQRWRHTKKKNLRFARKNPTKLLQDVRISPHQRCTF